MIIKAKTLQGLPPISCKPKVPKAVAAFADWLCLERGLSPSTSENYTRAVSVLLQFVNNNPSALLVEHVRDYIRRRREEGVKSVSINQDLAAFRTFHRYLVLSGYAVANFVSGVSNLKYAKPLPQFIEADKIEAALASLPLTSWKQRRTHLTLLLLWVTGVRISELVALRLSDIQDGAIHVHGKGRKERLIPISADTQKAIFALHELAPVRSEYLLFQQTGAPVLLYQVRIMLRRALAGFVSPALARPHIIRHSFATALMNSGARLEALRLLLGHEYIDTTTIYESVSLTALQREYVKCFA